MGNDLISTMFPQQMDPAKKQSSQLQLSNIASTLLQHLNAAVLFNQYTASNANNSNNPSTSDHVAAGGASNSTALDLSIKNEPTSSSNSNSTSNSHHQNQHHHQHQQQGNAK